MSTTYKLWIDGAEQGPIDKATLIARWRADELPGGTLWRRTGAATFSPLPELRDELFEPVVTAPAPEVEMEPKGESWLGQGLLGVGLVGFALGLLVGVAALFGEVRWPGVGAFISGSLSLAAIGAVLDIQAKLELIAHRLRK